MKHLWFAALALAMMTVSGARAHRGDAPPADLPPVDAAARDVPIDVDPIFSFDETVR